VRTVRFAIVVFAVLLVSCAPALVRHRTVRTDINGLPVDLTQLGGLSCSSIGIGHRPSQGDIDLCKKFLTPIEGAVLQICWEEFYDVVGDGVHNVKGRVVVRPYNERTCPILTLYPLQHGHDTGTITDADFARRMYEFYCEKYKQGLDDNAKKKAKARLVASGLPIPT
jgi:hypothetical protein